MTFLEVMQVSLPLILYVAAITLLITLVVLVIKLIKTMNKIDKIVDDVDKKVKSLDGVFSIIDFCTDKISSVTNRLVDRLTNLVIGFGKKKYNKNEEERVWVKKVN